MVKSLAYCFTLNNPTADEYGFLIEGDLDERLTYCVFQLEIGSEGTQHLQGYVQLSTRSTMQTVKAILGSTRIHLISARGTDEENENYCTKEESRIEGPYRHGERKVMAGQRGKSDTLLALTKKLKEGTSVRDAVFENDEFLSTFCRYKSGILSIESWCQEKNQEILEHFDNEWIYGEPGTGKSHSARLHNPNSYDKLLNKWWDGYNGQEVVILDDMTKDIFKMLFQHLLRWLDKYPVRVEMKGTAKLIRPKKIIITSNYPLTQMFDRMESDPEEMDPKEEIAYKAIRRRFANVTHWTAFCVCSLCRTT